MHWAPWDKIIKGKEEENPNIDQEGMAKLFSQTQTLLL